MRYRFLALVLCTMAVAAIACDESMPTSPDAGAASAPQAMLAKHPVKTDTKTCEVGQTVTWDGEIWVCTDLPPAAYGWEFQKQRCDVRPGQVVHCRATCNPGKKILGGGYSFWPDKPGLGEITITTDKPVWVDDHKAWLVTATNYSGRAYSYEVYGLCAHMEFGTH